jgi:hydroxyethylthiazole kinase-like uncharacterized protein yjeF
MNYIDKYNEEVLGVDTVTLMGRAGKALAREALKLNKKKITVVCGGGNNGGDGLACAGILADFLETDVFLTGEVKSQAAKYYLEQLQKTKVKIYKDFENDFSRYDIIIDAILGTGLKKEVRNGLKEIIRAINESGAFVISADIPSGLNSDNGLVEGFCVKADLTVTFAGYKPGQFLNQGPDYCGRIILDDIGAAIPEGDYVFVPDKIKLPERKKSSHKGDFANIKIIAGSANMCGAAYLGLSAANAALTSGAGLVTLAAPESIKCAYMPRVTESMLFFLSDFDGKVLFKKDEIDNLLQKADVLIIGMGLGKSAEITKIIDYVLKNYSLTVIIDADGINSLYLESLKDTKCRVILTPHIGEFARLINVSTDEVRRDSIQLAKRFSADFGVITVLKSNATVITDGIKVLVNITGTPAQAKGGSGDCLAGCMGALQKVLPPLDACFAACFICGLAAQKAESLKGSYSVLASDIIENIPGVIKELTEK